MDVTPGPRAGEGGPARANPVPDGGNPLADRARRVVREYRVDGKRIFPNAYLAPMSGVTDLPFRRLISRLSGGRTGLLVSEFITVEGRVEGDLHGSGAVTVKESANIDGNIFSPTVSLLEGANFNGSIEMKKKRAEAAQAPRSGDSGSQESRPAARTASGSR